MAAMLSRPVRGAGALAELQSRADARHLPADRPVRESRLETLLQGGAASCSM